MGNKTRQSRRHLSVQAQRLHHPTQERHFQSRLQKPEIRVEDIRDINHTEYFFHNRAAIGIACAWATVPSSGKIKGLLQNMKQQHYAALFFKCNIFNC